MVPKRKTSSSEAVPEIVEGEGVWDGRLLHFESLDSTNGWALAHMDLCKDGDVIEAKEQKAGKGRLSRSWFAPDDRGLAVSFVLRDMGKKEWTPMLGQAAALSVRDALRSLSIRTDLKWPNDVLVDGKKIAGILAQMGDDGTCAVVGVGLNVNVTEKDFLVAELGDKATSMLLVSRYVYPKDDVRRRLVKAFQGWIDRILERGASAIVEGWKESDWLAGHMVEIHTGETSLLGECLGIDEKGRLRLKIGEETEQQFWTGDAKRTARARS